MRILLFVGPLLLSLAAQSTEVCSRIATVNYQKILADTGSTGKGEGLRFYLEKDPRAKELLDTYQRKSRLSWITASISTVGSAMAIYGLMSSNEGGSGLANRNNLIIGGVGIVALSYLISRTIQYNNEFILREAVEQYNKRNRPRIFFSPFKDRSGVGAGLSIRQGF